MIKGAIFDVDGTLLDSMGIWVDAGTIYLQSQGVFPKDNLGEALFRMSLEEGGEYIRLHYLPDRTAREIIDGVLKVVENYYLYEVSLKPGVREILEKLQKKKIPMTVATSSDRYCITKAFERLGILQYFEEIFTCTEVGAGKRQPDIYLRAAERIGERPEAICVFEDALHAAQTAKAAGFQVAGVKDSCSEGEQEKLREISDYYIESFEAFAEKL